jgi:transcriptional regulator with PAS, ATPase and Fis domain
LQEKQVARLGSTKVVPVNVRIICATNRNLYSEVQKGIFRQDLYYRLNVISLRIVPLRERREDIPLLIKHFLVQIDRHWMEHLQEVDPRVWALLQNYNWPGNVRELQNITERIVLASDGYRINPSNLPKEIIDSLGIGLDNSILADIPHPAGIKSQKADLERSQIIALLKQFNGNVSRVAKEMDVSRRTIHRKIKLYDIER